MKEIFDPYLLSPFNKKNDFPISKNLQLYNTKEFRYLIFLSLE